MLFYFDETGDQGFVEEIISKEFYGAIVGIAINESDGKQMEHEFAQLLKKIDPNKYKKLHCTEIFRNDQNIEILNGAYEILEKSNNFAIINEAAYSVGVKKYYDLVNSLLSSIPLPQYLKLNIKNKKVKLYNELLEGIIVKLECFAELNACSEIKMISDYKDIQSQKESKNILEDLKSSGFIHTQKIYNTETKRVLERKISTSFDSRINIKRIAEMEFLDYVHPLLFVADFLGFELLRHFRKKMKFKSGIQFHSNDMIDGFRLKNKVEFIGDNYFSDAVYKPD